MSAVLEVLKAHPDWNYGPAPEGRNGVAKCAGPGCEWEAVSPPLTTRVEDLHRAHVAEEIARLDAPVELKTEPLNTYSTQREEMLRGFNADVAGGKLTLVHDKGLHRYLTFRPRSGNFCWFDIITSPGQLTIRGDMGDYMFAREPDMLRDFFHRNVNPSYWAEKVLAQDVNSPVREYSLDRYKASVLHDFWHAREDYTPADAKELWREIRTSGPLNDYADYLHPNGAINELETFSSEVAKDFRFDTHGYDDFEDYGHHFLWCCHAVLFAARAYREHDKAKTLEGAES
ncbi:hypothetical protein HYP71_gp069 [Arthrobacter phage KBurrousTX]|uniref:Uncharacterized protein n=1 Tax=Arthrobacter phage KBurrousTX TaxID=2315608 RepID=A0A386K8M4_9CAUD|nr:hypothetical protein HYP71_gp069 [Arthrobacter phage KBurrousTX]AYD81563.1 hypothetical protein KBurrousTX_69 [Arthrobacter phage KBurrousTX]